jgi:hypothetical protein
MDFALHKSFKISNQMKNKTYVLGFLHSWYLPMPEEWSAINTWYITKVSDVWNLEDARMAGDTHHLFGSSFISVVTTASDLPVMLACGRR